MAGDLLSTPPPLAPLRPRGTSVAELRLIRSYRVGPSTYHRLLAEHGSAEAALDALPKVAAAAGVKRYSLFSQDAAERELELGTRLGASLLSQDDPRYPSDLKDISDAPPLLWATGRLDLLRQPSVAMVGARNASSLGRRMATKLATDLGQAGLLTASGLARGVDTAVHMASLDTGTIAVVAGGLDVIYPPENAKLHDEIAQKGVILSEQPLGLQPIARHFPRRNRIISGLARATVIIEAAAKSGSLITARNALDQGREVLAVPGHPFDARSSGCNMLLRDGATLVRSADDIIEALRQPSVPASNTRPNEDAPQIHPHIDAHAQILHLLGPSPLAEDQLIRDLGVPPGAVLPVLTRLEMEGQITRSSGGLLSLLPQDR